MRCSLLGALAAVGCKGTGAPTQAGAVSQAAAGVGVPAVSSVTGVGAANGGAGAIAVAPVVGASSSSAAGSKASIDAGVTISTAGGTGGAAAIASVGGTGGSAGAAAISGMSATSSDRVSCGSGMRSSMPFGCKFAWGTNDPSGGLSGFSDLQFVSKWVGYEVDKSGTIAKCDGCNWLSDTIKSTTLLPVYYAYFIGYFGHANGFMDGNQNPTGPNLTTDAAQLIRDHRAAIIEMYRSYAQQSAAVWKDKPLVWLLEGDFVQYAGDSQKNKLSYVELGQLASDITCAIKSQMPNAVVAINQSTWNADKVTNDFWDAMSKVDYDLVWTTGVADNQGFFDAKEDASSYNKATATYAYVHQKTARTILVDTSFGISGMSDTWSSASATALNARIADGVIAANVTSPAANYDAAAKAIEGQLHATCD